MSPIKTLHPPSRHRRTPAPRLRRAQRDIFLVDLDTFYVSVERARDPSLRGRPVVVGGRPDLEGGERGVVTCASYEARAYGVRAGMPLFQAAPLLPHDTVYLSGDHPAYGRASKAVMQILERFTPSVEAVSLDEAYLDMAGLERHHRSWLAAATAIHAQVRDETGLAVSIGVASTRAVAKIAANLAKPTGVLEVRRGEERAFLHGLPLEYLPGVGPRLRRDLARFNLHTIGDLAAVPVDILEETFGRVGTTLARRAQGLGTSEDADGLHHRQAQARQPKTRSISRETSFARSTADERFIDAMLSHLAQRAGSALRKDGSLARAVGVRLRYADFETVEVRRRFPRPTDSDHDILVAVKNLWRKRYERRVALRLAGVVLHDLVEVHDRQLHLPLEGGSPHGSLDDPLHTQLDATLDRVRDRHGFGAVVRGNAIDLLSR